MITNKKSIKVISLLLAILILSSNVAFASNISKSETVYVDLNSNGTTKEVISSVWIKSDEKLKDVKDKSTLDNLLNVKGDEEPEKDG
ncbi:MAG TPA: hypothetical protein VIG40_04875, partial [Tissierellaceae bacterium]